MSVAARSMRVTPLPASSAGGLETGGAMIEAGNTTHRLEYRSTRGPLSESSDAFLAATLFPAMRLATDLEIRGDVSSLLLASTAEIQRIFSGWYPEFTPVRVVARDGAVDRRRVGAASLFSGGVDSFYTLLRHQDEITTLIFVHGFDISLADTALRRRVSASLRAAAAELGKTLVEVHTNLRSFSERHIDWGLRYHGAGLASVALLLAPQFGRVYIPASFPRAYTKPHGSHPLLDPLWSTEGIEFVHDGVDATRLEKVQAITASDVAMRWLRVCWEHPQGEYNCGRCEKCVRTMVNLELAGALARCRAFDRPLDLAAVARAPVYDGVAALFVEENLQRCLEVGGHEDLARALRTSLDHTYYRGIGPLFRGDLRRRLLSRARRLLSRSSPPVLDFAAYEFQRS